MNSTDDRIGSQGELLGGRFQVYGTLASGGFSDILLVHFIEEGRVCALKRLKRELLADANASKLWEREARTWLELGDHPCIVAARWVQWIGEELIIAMDYVPADAEGRTTLFDHLSTTSFSLPQALRWMIHACMGLRHAYGHGVAAHRDLKPANLLISTDGILKVSDFGLAQPLSLTSTPGKTRILGNSASATQVFATAAGHWCGTPGYLAPETYASGFANEASDLYAMGLVLWQIARNSTDLPWTTPRRDDVNAWVQDIFTHQQRRPVLPTGTAFDTLIARCTAFDPADRFANFAELQVALEALLVSETGEHIELPKANRASAMDWNGRGVGFRQLGLFEKALDAFEQALTLEPGYAQAWNNQGNCLDQLGRHTEALASYDQALEAEPGLAETYVNRGRTLLAMGRGHEALQSIEHGLELQPRLMFGWLMRADTLLKMGRLSEALETVDNLTELSPRHGPGWKLKSNILLRLGRTGEAIDAMNQARRFSPRDPGLLFGLASLLLQVNRPKDALPVLDDLVQLAPDHAQAWSHRGDALDALGDRAREALESYQRAAELNPQDVNAWFGAGVNHNILDNHDEAIRCFAEVLRLAPENADTWYNKALAEEALGRVDAAAESFTRFLESSPQAPVRFRSYAEERLRELGADC